jgi:Zn-dependent protease with chaperone function
VVIAPELSSSLDDAELAAVLAHAAAHARHRDPLRLWLAQLVTDAQWPAVAASARFHRWRAAVEIARDAAARVPNRCRDSRVKAVSQELWGLG